MRMKRLLAVFLAVAMVMTGSVAAFAADDDGALTQELYISVSSYGHFIPDGLVDEDLLDEAECFTIPANGRKQVVHHELYLINNKDNVVIEKIAFEKGNFKEVILLNSDSSGASLYTETTTVERRYGTVIEDTMKVTLSDGQIFDIKMAGVVYDEIAIDLLDANGKYLSDPYPIYVPTISGKPIPLTMDKDYIFTILVMDDLNSSLRPEYTIEVTDYYTHEDAWDVFPESFAKAAVGTITQKGKEFSVPISLSSENLDSYTFPITVRVEKEDPNYGHSETERTFVFEASSNPSDVPTADPDDPYLPDDDDDDDNNEGNNGGNGDTTDDPNKPATNPKPSTTPSTSGGSSKSTDKSSRESSNTTAEKSALETVKSANDGKSTSKVQNFTTAAGTSVPAVSVKLYGFDVSLSIDMMRTLAQGSTGLKVNLNNGAAHVLIPPAFDFPSSPGVLGYDLAYQSEPMYNYLMRALVKGDNTLTETHRLGGGQLPTPATITLKTKLAGTVNVYHWDESTRKATFLTTGNAEAGKVTFATKQLGNLIVTNGTI